MTKLTCYRRWYRLLLALVMGLLGTACSESTTPLDELSGDAGDISIILYEEQVAGTDPYIVRILVSAGYVRFDDGYDASDYVLLDRRSRTLYSVVHENQSVLEILNQPYSGSFPSDLEMSDTRSQDDSAPTISGKHSVHVDYLANGESCYQAVSVPGLMDKAVAGMAEFAAALGERQLANMETVPEAMQTPCFLSRYAYAPGRHFTQGLPVQIWDEFGYHSSLTDFQDGKTVAPGLFEVPENYERLLMAQ